MTSAPEKQSRQMPKGGRKGGSSFPRVALNDAIGYARKLVSKTHTAPQPKDVILSGVIGTKGGNGAVRMSALKQYGFLKGDGKVNYSADDLARKIAAAPTEELAPLYRQAMLKPTVFKKLFDTFHGDTVSKAKLKQRAADLKVHPEETATCVELYVSGMTIAGLVTVVGDQVKHLASSDVAAASAASAVGEAEPETIDEEPGGEESTEAQDSGDDGTGVTANGANESEKTAQAQAPKDTGHSGPRAVFNVNVTLDSSLDIEKLQKQLELLKRFGAI
jgi:hypothetical protein